MKKIQAKKKKDRAEAEANAKADAISQAAPTDGQTKNMLDKEDDIPVLF